MPQSDNPERIFHLLVADALEALIAQVDNWEDAVRHYPHAGRPGGYPAGYEAGVRRMAAEVKDQLVERMLRLREE